MGINWVLRHPEHGYLSLNQLRQLGIDGGLIGELAKAMESSGSEEFIMSLLARIELGSVEIEKNEPDGSWESDRLPWESLNRNEL